MGTSLSLHQSAGKGLATCAGVPDRPPTVLTTDRLKGLPRSASHVPHTFSLCESRSIHCQAVINLTSPFTQQRPAPPALGLMPSDTARLRQQFWWQTHPELAPRPFGWILPYGGSGDGGSLRPRRDGGSLERAKSLAGLYHSYAVGIGRATAPGGAFVELCKRCTHEGALYVPPSGAAPGVNALVDWAARIIKEPARRMAQRARPQYYKRAAAKPVVSYARLLVLVQRFSADYGHFMTELLPRAAAAIPQVRADPALRLLVDCSAGFVLPWLTFLLDIDRSRLVCTDVGDRLVHADCLAFSRFTSPFPSGWRLGLDILRRTAYSQLQAGGSADLSGVGRQWAPPYASGRPLVVWADRDLGRLTAHGVRCVHGVPALLAALKAAMPTADVAFFRASQHTPHSTVDLFSKAAAVLGPSGSAMHNIIFCRPGTLVVEILPEDLTYANIWQDASVLGLVYRAVHVPGFRCSNNATLGGAEVRRIVDGTLAAGLIASSGADRPSA